MPMSSQKSIAKLCCNQFRNWQPITASLPIQKSATKLCRCQLRNRQPKTMSMQFQKKKIISLPIQKLAANNCSAADSKIGSQIADADSKIDNKTVSLSLQKSIAKNCIAANSEISNDVGVISALLLFFSFFFYIIILNNHFQSNFHKQFIISIIIFRLNT